MCWLEEHARVCEETVFCPLSLSYCHVPHPPQRPLRSPITAGHRELREHKNGQLVLEPGEAFQTHISTWWHSEIKMHLMQSSLVAYVTVIENNMKILQFHRLKYI